MMPHALVTNKRIHGKVHSRSAFIQKIRIEKPARAVRQYAIASILLGIGNYILLTLIPLT